RAAFHIDLAAGDCVQAVGRVESCPLDFQRREPEALLDRRRNARTQLGAVSAHAAVALFERERSGARAITQAQRSVGLDALESARWLGGMSERASDKDQACGDASTLSGAATASQAAFSPVNVVRRRADNSRSRRSATV